jgi:hypothetical protein
MTRFFRPGFFDDYNTYREAYVKPHAIGSGLESNESEQAYMRQQLDLLKARLEEFMHFKDKDVLEKEVSS